MPVRGLELDGRDEPDLTVQAPVIEPVDVFGDRNSSGYFFGAAMTLILRELRASTEPEALQGSLEAQLQTGPWGAGLAHLSSQGHTFAGAWGQKIRDSAAARLRRNQIEAPASPIRGAPGWHGTARGGHGRGPARDEMPDQAVVDLLGRYSKHQRPGNTAISVLDEALRGRRKRHVEQTPTGIRNARPPRERVRVLNNDEVKELVECYRAGESTYALSRRFGIRRDTVSAHLRRNGVMPRVNTLIVLDAEQQARVVELYGAGLSMKHVAEEVGVSERAVARGLQQAGVARRHRRRAWVG